MGYSISEIASILIKRLWIIVLCISLSTVGAFAVTKLIIDEKYTTSVSMYVAPNTSDEGIYASLNVLNYAKQVVDTYIEILYTNVFMESVAKASGLPYSIKELKNMIAINVVNNTEIFQIRVTTTEPEESLLLANTISRLAPKKIIEIKNADAVKVVDPPTLPIEPSSPNVLLNTFIGFLLGLALGTLCAFILGILDKRVMSEDDLIKQYRVPVLGIVPTIDEKRGAVYGDDMEA